MSKKLKLILKNTVIDKTLTFASETSALTKREGKQLNIFERKVYRRILGPVYNNGKENWRILTFIILAHRSHLIPQRTNAPQLMCCGHLNAPYTHVDT
jgi:hypothetical protein